MDFVANVRRLLLRHKMAPAGARVLCAVSGGPDSMAMFSALCALRAPMRFELGAAYVDHGLRRRAKAERRFVEREARRSGVPFHAASVNVRSASRRDKISVEATARELRYGALASIARRHGYDRIATGHTANDQAETVLMHVISGTGLDGLAGILPVRSVGGRGQTGLSVCDGHGRDRFTPLSAAPDPIPRPGPVPEPHPSSFVLHPFLVIRPLLAVTRKEVEAFLRAKKIPSVADETNVDPRFERNRLRRLLPRLERELNPSLVRALARLAENAREDAEALESMATKAFNECVNEAGGLLVIDRRRVNALPRAIRARVLDRALRQAAPRARFDRVHIETLAGRIASGTGTSTLHLPGGIEAKVTYDSAVLAKLAGRRVRCRSLIPQPSTLIPCPVVVPGPGAYDVPWAAVAFRFGGRAARSTVAARLDRTVANYPFVIRPFRPGDRIAPPFARHARKLKKILIDKKIPREDRRRLPILCCGETVVWVPGVTTAPSSTLRYCVRVVVSPIAK